LQITAEQMNAAMAGRCWPLTADDALALLGCLQRAAEGDAAPLRAFRRHQHVGEAVRKQDEDAGYLRRLPHPKKSPQWRSPLFDAVPPPIPDVASPEPPYGYVRKQGAGGHSVRYASPGQQLLDRIGNVLLVLELKNQIGLLRALERCERCEQVFVQTDGRRTRGPQRVCSGCRPEAHRAAWKVQKRRQRTPSR